MAILIPKASSTDSASPVTWYLMVWIQLTLATNSMAQPSGRISGASSRYRIYLCSSPFFCLADGLAILMRVLVSSICFRISPLKASRLAIISRADERHHSLRNKDTCFDDNLAAPDKEGPPTVTAAAWPRWLFFLVGTVPAAIQLASFSGVAVSQALGLMFVSSFAVIELVAFLSTFEESDTIAEVLGYLKVEGVTIEEEELRCKTFKFMVCLEWGDTVLLIMALIAQAAMMFELFYQLWVPATVSLSKLFENTFMELMSAIYSTIALLLQVALVIRFVLRLAGIGKSLDTWLSLIQCLYYWLVISCLMVFVPHRPISSKASGFERKTAIFLAVCMIIYGFHWAVSMLSERYHSTAKALLIGRRPWDLAKIEHLPPNQRTGIELETGIIHSSAWSSFCIFLSNLVVCVL